MPIPFSSIPAEIRDRIVQKLNLLDFVSFSQVSRKSFEAEKNVKTKYAIEWKYPLPVCLKYVDEDVCLNFCNKRSVTLSSKIFDFHPVRLNNCNVLVVDVFSEELYNSFVKFLSRTNSSVDKISLWNVTVPVESLNRLVEIGKIKEMSFYRPFSSYIMKITHMKNTAELTFDGFVKEADILSLQTTNFTLNSSNLTSAGAHLIITQLIAGERYIDSCKILTSQRLITDLIVSGIPNLESTFFNPGKFTYFGNSGNFCVAINGHYFSIKKIRNL